MAKTNKIDSLISSLENHNTAIAKDIKLMTSEDVVKIKPLTIGQQKQIVKSIVQNVSPEISLDNTIYAILMENVIEGPPIYLLDMSYILLQLRHDMYGPDLVLFVEDEEYKINLNQHLNHVSNKISKIKDTKYTVQSDNIKINCEAPTLQIELDRSKQAEDYIKTEFETIGDATGDIYLIEVAKQIKSVEINDQLVDLSKATLQETIEVVNKIPYSLTKQISDKIKQQNQIDMSIRTNDDLPEGVQISVDSTLFTAE